MRIYAPSPTVATLERLLDDPSIVPTIAARRVLPARAAVTAPFPHWLDQRLVSALKSRGIESLYSHQADALDALRAGRDVVIVTPTASGKSLCYDLPVMQALAEDPSARALYLFPTKALSQDQLAGFRELATAADFDFHAAVYDGDTPAPIRSSIRTAGQVIVTNPDMLHSGVLPHHTKWFQLFEQLRYIVVDETHTYRGVFGSHVGDVLRRLLRLCDHYGSKPQIICCSATIGNPQTLAETLTGRAMTVIDRNGAPAGEKHVVVLNPPLVDPRLGVRGSGLGLSRRAALAFIRAGRQTIVFGRSRHAVELILSGLRDNLREGRGPVSRVRGYRSGYLPTERRAIEAGLRSGEILGVVSTNALELGIDIGRLDVSILAGYPGTIAATWQQMGRAGRRADASVSILVAGPGPVDQFVVAHPEYLFDSSPEEARLDPTNLHVLLAHLRAATFELPFEPQAEFAGVATEDLLEFLAEEAHVRRADDQRWYWASDNFPASEISLRVAAPENVVIIDDSGPKTKVIGEVDLFSARTLVHDNAIYLHEARQYHVERLDWEERRAYVKPVDVDYYTMAEFSVTLKPLEIFGEAPVTAGERVHGEVMVSTIATLYKKLRLETHENLGWGKIYLPEIELHTTSYWLALELAAVADWRRDQLDTALAGAGRALQTVGSVLLMSDPHDLGMVAQVRSPHAERPVIYLYDGVPGGVGLAQRLFDRHAELVAGALSLVEDCECEEGCPACVGPGLSGTGEGKRDAWRLLKLVSGEPVKVGVAA